jgi:hypothetical protein
MTDPSTSEALRRLRDRLGHLIELIASEPDTDLWGDVLLDEVTLIVTKGPDRYLRYVQHIDDKAVRAQLDEELDRILGRTP